MSTSGMPEIGSRISLISKADIRYEGKLFAVDPEECTIALSSVRSYGTEDRDTMYPVPAQQQVYDYILFRGSDIKDIRVLTTTIPNDPAIVQLSVPPSISDQQFQSRLAYTQPPLTSMGMPNVVPGTSRQPAQSQSVFTGLTNVPQPTTATSKPVTTTVSDESRSSTPSAQNNAASTKTAEVHRTSADSGKSTEEQQNRRQNSGRDQQRVQGGGRFQQGGNRPQQRFQQRYPQQQQQRYGQDQQQRYGQQDQSQRYGQQDQSQRYGQQDQPQRYGQQDQSQRYGQQDQQQRYGQQDQQQRYGQQGGQYRDYNRDQYRNYDYRDSYGGERRPYSQQPLRNMQQRDNWQSYGPQRRLNQNRMGQTQQNQNYQNRGGVGTGAKPRNTLKFENDYDFEQANNEFEEMRTKLAKTKLDGGPKMNGDVEKKDDSGKEESGGEENEPIVDSVETENGGSCGDKEVFYDKVKSFFDQISYEAIERSKGLTTRMDWKTERKINTETFGQVAFRRNNMGGNYRVGPRMNMSGGGGGGGGGSGGGYYSNYQNRNTSGSGGGMTTNYRQGGYNRGQQQQQQRTRQYNSMANKSQETNKEAKVAA